MYSKLFHKDIYFPQGAKESALALQKEFNEYNLSRHLQEHLNTKGKDRSHNYLDKALEECLNTIQDNPQEPFEIELSKDYHLFGKKGWFVTKYCIRIPYNKKEDLVVSIRPRWNREKKNYDFDNNLVVTAWLNDNKDHHYTLDETKYCNEKGWNTL